MFTLQLLALSGLATLAASQCQGPAPAQPPPPSQDPFYTPPTGWQSATAGSILRNRDAPGIAYQLNCNFTLVSAVKQLLYRTTDSFDQPAVAVVTVLTPQDAFPANTSRLLVYQPPMDSASLDCSPSYQWGFNQDSVQSKEEPGAEIHAEEYILNFATSRGYYVAVTDYETTKASFLSGVTEGRAVLDATDAVLHSGSITNVSATADVILTGYSGGSYATEWAAELQASYKPSLTPRIKSVVAGGLPANVTFAIPLLNKSPVAGLIPNGLVGIANSNASFAAALDGALIDNSTLKAQFYSVRTCAKTLSFENVDIFKTYFKDGESFLYNPSYEAVVASQGIMGRHGIPHQDLFFFQGCNDTVVGVQPADQLVKDYCSSGQNVQLQYVKFANATHACAALDGYGTGALQLGPAFQHIVDRFNGITSQKTCPVATPQCQASLTQAICSAV